MISSSSIYPGHAGVLENPDAVGCEGRPGDGGAYMVFTLHVSEGLILEARFLTHGSPAAITVGEMLADWVVGKTLAEARAITPGELRCGASAASGLSAAAAAFAGREASAARLAVNALRDALDQFHRWRTLTTTAVA